MSIDNKTTNLKLPLPNSSNRLADDEPRIEQAFGIIDTEIGNLKQTVSGHAGSISSLNQDVSALDEVLTTLDGQVDALEDRIEDLEQNGGGSGTSVALSAPSLTLAAQSAIGYATTLSIADGAIKLGDSDHYLVTVGSSVEVQVAATNGAASYSFTPSGNEGDVVTVKVRAVDALGNVSLEATASTTLIRVGIAAAVITSPANGETSVALAPTFTLAQMATIGGASDTAKKVRLQIATDTEFTNVVYDTGEITASRTVSVPAANALDRNTDYKARAYWVGNAYGQGDWSSVVAFTTLDAQVLGVCQTATGSAGQTFARIDVSGTVATTPTFNSHPIYSNIVEVTVDSQYMVRFPKFFVKRETLASGAYVGKDARLISDVALPGYDIHPAFLAQDGSTALDYLLIGKYQGSDGGSSKLASVPNVSPKVSINFTTMQTWCANRNTGGVSGFHLWNVWEWSMVDLLMLIELGGTDMQTLIGRGHVDNSPSGVQKVDHATVAQASWRGLVGLWGNIWQMCDGFKANATYYLMNMGKGYKETTIAPPAAAIYPNSMLKDDGTGWSFKHLFIGSGGSDKGTSNADSAYPDTQYLYKNSNEYVLYVGGDYGYGDNAGPFNARVYNFATYSDSLIGGRLAKW